MHCERPGHKITGVAAGLPGRGWSLSTQHKHQEAVPELIHTESTQKKTNKK